MPKKGNRKQPQPQQQNEACRAEQAKLRELLMERSLFRHGMKIKEMRELSAAIEQSMLDQEMHQRSTRFHHGTITDEDLLQLRDCSLLEGPSGSSEKVNMIISPTTPPTDVSPPKSTTGQSPSTIVPEFSPLTSPEGGKYSKAQSAAAADDSDSDGFYSPEFPGPCCRVIHTVQVEVHPEPRAVDDEDDGDDDGPFQRLVAPQGIRSSPRKQVKWDSIDELV